MPANTGFTTIIVRPQLCAVCIINFIPATLLSWILNMPYMRWLILLVSLLCTRDDWTVYYVFTRCSLSSHAVQPDSWQGTEATERVQLSISVWASVPWFVVPIRVVANLEFFRFLMFLNCLNCLDFKCSKFLTLTFTRHTPHFLNWYHLQPCSS